MTHEAAERFLALREAGTPSAEAPMANYPAMARATTANPDAWILSVRVDVCSPLNAVVLPRHVVRSGRRAVGVETHREQ
jgi:hypothetical protein